MGRLADNTTLPVTKRRPHPDPSRRKSMTLRRAVRTSSVILNSDTIKPELKFAQRSQQCSSLAYRKHVRRQAKLVRPGLGDAVSRPREAWEGSQHPFALRTPVAHEASFGALAEHVDVGLRLHRIARARELQLHRPHASPSQQPLGCQHDLRLVTFDIGFEHAYVSVGACQLDIQPRRVCFHAHGPGVVAIPLEQTGRANHPRHTEEKLAVTLKVCCLRPRHGKCDRTPSITNHEWHDAHARAEATVECNAEAQHLAPHGNGLEAQRAAAE
eukprot:scaffold21478_cov67-Phaeocystis_antarctica.AAC.2